MAIVVIIYFEVVHLRSFFVFAPRFHVEVYMDLCKYQTVGLKLTLVLLVGTI